MRTLTPSTTNQAAVRAYNLFRRRMQPDLVCAVPEDRAVPTFVTGDGWEFQGKASEAAALQRDFDVRAARASVRFNGFYLYHAYDWRGSDVAVTAEP